MNDKIKKTLDCILEIFKSGQIPEAISFAAFPPFEMPSRQWSYLNHILMWASNTNDARGYRQWKQVERHVKKGATAFHILAPRFKREKIDNGEDDYSLVGFLEIPVFRYEDTEGEPLNYHKTEINSFPLVERALTWGLDVHAVEGNGYYWGVYNGDSIKLATPEESVFFHELAHHAHKLVVGNLRDIEEWRREVVAELSAESLSRIVGLKQATTGNSYRYIERYATQAGLTPITACLQVLNDVEQVLNLILGKEE